MDQEYPPTHQPPIVEYGVGFIIGIIMHPIHGHTVPSYLISG
jgi:hypothetical protein